MPKKNNYLGITDEDFLKLAQYAGLKKSSMRKFKNAFLNNDFEELFYEACWAKQAPNRRKPVKEVSSLENTAKKLIFLLEQHGGELNYSAGMYYFGMLEEYKEGYKQLGIVSEIPKLNSTLQKVFDFDLLIQQLDIIVCRAKVYRSSSFMKGKAGQKSLEPFKNYIFKAIEIYEENSSGKKFRTSRKGKIIKNTPNFLFLKLVTAFLNREISYWAKRKNMPVKKLLYTDKQIMTAYESHKKMHNH